MVSKQVAIAYFVVNSKEARQEATTYVSKLTAEPVMIVEVKRYKKNRSSAQNRLMWMWYGIMSKELGNEPEELHEAMKVRVLGVDKKIVLGQPLIVPKSSTNLNTGEMTKFLEAVEALAKELNINLPHPQDYHYIMTGQI